MMKKWREDGTIQPREAISRSCTNRSQEAKEELHKSKETNWLLKEQQRQGSSLGPGEFRPLQLPITRVWCLQWIGILLIHKTSSKVTMEWKADKYMLQTAERKPLEEFNDWKRGNGHRQECLSEVCNHRLWWWCTTIQTQHNIALELWGQLAGFLSLTLYMCSLRRPWRPSCFCCCKHGEQHSAVHGCVRIPSSDRQVSEMQASNSPSWGHNGIWKTCSPAIHTNSHQQETLIQPHKHYLAIIKKKLQITNRLDFHSKPDTEQHVTMIWFTYPTTGLPTSEVTDIWHMYFEIPKSYMCGSSQEREKREVLLT